ncbi:hypothetical protein ACWD9K_14690 [Streptomyces sp. 900116325]
MDRGAATPSGRHADRAVRPLGGPPATPLTCLLDGARPNDYVAELRSSEHGRLVGVDTGIGRCSRGRTSPH